MTTTRPLALVVSIPRALFVVAACHQRSDVLTGDGDIDTFCREEPRDDSCDGEIGGRCDVTDDCYDGVCCRDDGNCGGGMCLYECDDDGDCPDNQRCEHDHCFFRCDDDSDCGPGQSCEHGDTICEYD